jgi:hypothetical protein
MTDKTNDRTEYVFTPEMRVVLAYTHEVDEVRRIKTKDGKTKTIGNGKYKLRGYFDPDTEAGKAFLAAASEALQAYGLTDKEARRTALRRSFKTRAEDKTAPDGIPETWRRLTASTQFGPVEVIDRRDGEEVPKTAFYPGCWAIAQVAFYVYEDERTGDVMVTCRLGPVLKTKDDTRLGGGGRPPARAVFADHLGVTTKRDPFGEDEDESPI